MANETYPLSQSASEVQLALDSVIAAPNNAIDANQTGLVSGQTIHNYVNAVTVTTASFAGSALVEDSTDGLTATDTAIPTSKAVRDYVDTSSIKIASYGSASGDTVSANSPNILLPVTEVSDPSNIGSVSSGTVTLAAGAYLVVFNGEFAEDNNDNGEYFLVQLRHNGVVKTIDVINETGTTYVFKSTTMVVSANSLQSVDIYLTNVGGTRLYYRNVSLAFIKLA